MDEMHSNMLSRFGMSDPFKDDPFFNRAGGGIFERAE
jgi:hypothetical protein